MDLTTIGIFIGFFLTGIVAGIPIGTALEQRRLRRACWPSELKAPAVVSKEEVENILSAREIS